MEITFFHWNKDYGYSIPRSFRPLIDELKERKHTIKEYYVPYYGSNPINLIKNIYFTYKHRSKNGINHITGDIHYCMIGLVGTKSILTIHDDYAIITSKNLIHKIYRWFFWIFLPIIISDKTLCITQATLIKIKKYIKSNNIEIFTQHTIKDFVQSRKIFNKKTPTILQVGTNQQKNLESTILALKDISCHLRVIKPMTQKQHELARTIGIDYSNVFNLSDEDIIKEYNNADIIVFPSLFEGFGMPIIEGQATGKIVITSNIPPMNWVAGDGAALLKDPLDIKEYHNLILKVIQDDEYRNNLIEKGLDNIKRFSIKETANKYELLCKLITTNEK